MNKTIKLVKIDNIDSTYQNVMDFSSSAARSTFFNSLPNKTFNINVRDDGLISQLVLPTNHTNIYTYNYLYMIDETNKELFFFILSMDHTTSTNTTLYIQLDIFTTYQFNFTILDSFVDRCHVQRWNGDNPTPNTIDEGLPINEYILDSTQDITSFSDSLIVSSTQPLGVCQGFNLPNNGNGSTGEPSDGNPTKTGFRFIKGYEAFSPSGFYLNNESFRTVGYGSTETSNIDYYNQHKPFPCTEQLASEIFAERYTKDFGAKVWKACQDANISNKITLNKLDAMCSLAYNCGFYGFTSWSTSPWQLIKSNPDDLENIRAKWLTFAITGGSPPVEMEGLKLRRIAESNIYCDNIYEFRDILIYKDRGDGVGIPSGEIVTDNRGDGFIPDYLPDLTPSLEIIIEKELIKWQ